MNRPAPFNPNAGQGLPGGVTLFRVVTPIPRFLRIGSDETVLAEVNVPFFATGLVSKQAITRGLVDKGLIPLDVVQVRPGYWPLLSKASWYVTARNPGDSPRNVELPSGIDRLWRLSLE